MKIYLIIFLFLNFLIAFAADFSSSNFISRDPIISDFGGRSASANFEQLNVGGQTVIGESTSQNFILRSGFLYFEEKVFTPKSKNWRWFDDEDNETPTAPLAPENTAPTNVSNQNIIKLRLTVKETAGAAGLNVKFKLQFSEYSDFSQGVNDVAEMGNCATNSLWCYGDGIDTDNAPITTLALSDSTAAGTHNESGISAGTFDPPANTTVEYEFTIKHAGARAGATYFFRAFDAINNQPVPLGTEETFPSLSAESGILTFSVTGVPAGTPTEGIVTNIDTSPTTISFGGLNFGAETNAAQRLAVTTNATEGYQIFIFQRQNFLNSKGAEIAPIANTNENPAGWVSGCEASVAGCYGYHAGDDTLADISTRFAADDTYVKLEFSAKEVAFSSVPVTNESNDIIFRAQITNQQEPGVYETSLGYIIIPIF